MPHHVAEAAHAVIRAILAADLAALRVVWIAPFVAGEGDDIGKAGFGAGVNGLLGPLNDLLMEPRVVEAAHEGGSWHTVGGHRANEAVFAERAPIFRRHDF